MDELKLDEEIREADNDAEICTTWTRPRARRSSLLHVCIGTADYVVSGRGSSNSAGHLAMEYPHAFGGGISRNQKEKEKE